ncbi:MAG TPA: NAD(P)-dependent oxidoreductase [Candidatus Goldiibacteriota bacterium]|nr:NAD(P)-dependent oxidoreductase [Candidatus Goldiibacteriota bacterium]
MRVYLTGGTGFIGSYVARELAGSGASVTVLARNMKKAPGLLSLPGVDIMEFSLSDPLARLKSVRKIDALVLVALAWGDTGPDMIRNETLRQVELIDLAVKKGVKKVIFTSSTAAAGPIKITSNEDSLRRPSDFYGATKGSVELFLSAYSAYFPKIQFNVIRPGYTFGRPCVEGGSMEPDSRFRDICRKAKKGERLELIMNDGTQFLWAGDLAKVYAKLLESSCKNEIFYALSENFITWEQIGKWAFKYAGTKPKFRLFDKGWSDNPPLYSVEKIKKHFGLSFNSSETVKEHVRHLIGLV